MRVLDEDRVKRLGAMPINDETIVHCVVWHQPVVAFPIVLALVVENI